MKAKTKQKKPLSNFTLLLIILGLVYILSFLIPSGNYERVDGMVDPNSFATTEKTYLNPISVLLAMPKTALSGSGSTIIAMLVVGGAIGVVISSGALDMKKITPNLLQELQAMVNPRLSSSGRYLCYTVKQCSQDLEGYSSKLFWMDLKTGQRQEIVSPHRTASGVWDKDTLFLVSPAGNGRTRWETWSPQDGRQERFELPVACGGGMFLNNGQLLVRAAQPKPDENGMPFVVEEYPYTSDGKGWTCGKQEALYLYDQEKKQLIKISPQDARIQLSYAWEDKIAFTGWLSKDSVCERPGLYVYCQRKGHWEQYLAPGKYYIRQLFALRHDLYFAGSDGSKYGRYEYTGFFRVDAQHSCADLFASYGNNVGLNSVLNDTFTDPGKKICTDGDALYFITSVHHRSGVKRLSADGTISDFLTQAVTVESLDCANGTLVYCGSKQMHTPELYQVDQAGERCLAQAA